MGPLPPKPSHIEPPYPPPCDDDASESGCWTPPVPPAPPPYPPPSSAPPDHGRSTFVTALIVAGAAVAFLVLCLSVFLFVRRRRQQWRQRQEALLEAALGPAAPAAFPDGGGPGEEGEEEEGEEVVHHAWHIQTVGLDDAAIESIALTRYRAGAGGASDCAVCLGEFADGELLRLLPKCAHAFHVPCIDTWLRAHVNCPLCRTHVLDPAAAEEPSDSAPVTDADAGAEGGVGALEHEQPDRQENEQLELRVQIDEHDRSSNTPEQSHPHHGQQDRSFRRVASMDSPSPVASPEDAPEDGQVGGEKRGAGGAVHSEISQSSDCPNSQRGMKRSLSTGSRWALVSRHCRRPSSLLPL